MKNSIIYLCLSLLFAAFMLSCQQQESSPVSPEEESISFSKKPDKPTVVYEINLEGSFLSTPKILTTNLADRRTIHTNDATLIFNEFFQDKLSCDGQFVDELTGGGLVLHSGSKGNGHAALGFWFSKGGIEYTLAMWGKIADTGNWPPSSGTINSMTQLEEPIGSGLGGHWKLTAGKNNQNACTGEGDGLTFTATVTAL